MTSTKIALTIAALVALAGVAAAVHEYQNARVAEGALADVVAARPEAALANPSANRQQTPPGHAAQPGVAIMAEKRPNSPLSAFLDMLNNPAVQRQNEILAKMRLNGQYAALFKSLNLTPDQIGQFKDLLVEKEMVGFDSMSAARQQGIDAGSDPQGFFQAVAAAEKTVDAQISGLLGADGFNQFQQYQATIPARNTSSLLSQALSYTSTPLTDAQTGSVIQILTQDGTPALPPSNPFAVLNGDLGVVKLDEQGLAQIQGVLSAPQVQALQETIQQQSQLLEVRKRMGK
jgi:hypothetical protein